MHDFSNINWFSLNFYSRRYVGTFTYGIDAHNVGILYSFIFFVETNSEWEFSNNFNHKIAYREAYHIE